MEITDTDWIIGDNNPKMNLCDDLWHHIAIVHREECPAIKKYQNVCRWHGPYYSGNGEFGSEIMTPALCNVQIGRSLTNGDGADYFKGYIGDLQLYSVALPDREIQRISYMVEDYWDFEDTSFSGNNDVGNKTNGYHGTCYNAKRVYNPDAFIIGTKGLELTGNNSYVKMEGHKGITGSSSRTVSAWIRKTDDQNGTIISWGSATGAGKSWVFGVYDGKLRLSIDSVNYIEGSTVLDYGPNKWYFVAATVDKGKPTLGDVKLYVDGKEEITSVPTHSDADTSIKTEDGQDICIGTWNGSDYFKGYIDDVKIYPSSLREEDFALMPLYPGAVASLSNIVSVSGGAFHSIFLENNHSSAGSAGKVYVSGKNSEWGGYRLLGCGDQRDRAETPVAVRRHNPDVHELHYRFGNAFKVSIIKNEVGFGRDGELIGNIESSVRYIPCYWKDNKNFDRYYSFQRNLY